MVLQFDFRIVMDYGFPFSLPQMGTFSVVILPSYNHHKLDLHSADKMSFQHDILFYLVKQCIAR